MQGIRGKSFGASNVYNVNSNGNVNYYNNVTNDNNGLAPDLFLIFRNKKKMPASFGIYQRESMKQRPLYPIIAFSIDKPILLVVITIYSL